jgi:hypothetical protein
MPSTFRGRLQGTAIHNGSTWLRVSFFGLMDQQAHIMASKQPTAIAIK